MISVAVASCRTILYTTATIIYMCMCVFFPREVHNPSCVLGKPGIISSSTSFHDNNVRPPR